MKVNCEILIDTALTSVYSCRALVPGYVLAAIPFIFLTLASKAALDLSCCPLLRSLHLRRQKKSWVKTVAKKHLTELVCTVPEQSGADAVWPCRFPYYFFSRLSSLLTWSKTRERGAVVDSWGVKV